MTRKEIEGILKDYHWMINSIKIMRKSLDWAREGLTAQYGLEAALEEKVKFIQERIHVINDEREAEVLHWLLEGKSYRWIGQHMGLSFSHIKRIRDSIIEQLVTNETNGTNDTNGTNGTYGTKLRKEKSAC